ncbi:MAG: DEAD/DEAH box helicase, partial [Chloroflexi bacterium]
MHEWDWSATQEPIQTARDAFPTRDELFTRWTTALGLLDEVAHNALVNPYQLSRGTPRYYQDAAINRAIVAALQAKRGLRAPRILLTLATGTGKTKVAFQIVWKLKRARAIRNVLFLTDRDWLLSQAMDNEFSPFGDARLRVQGEAATSRDIVFATYQAIASDEVRRGLYREYPANFFDLVVVDECHRGSAGDESNWRSILEHFSGAVQIGLTATPLRTDNVQTYSYFGDPVYTYSLRAGINDGFLAPYRVRRILMGSVVEQSANVPDGDGATQETVTSHGGASAADTSETAGTLIERTPVIARHLAEYLRKTDPLAKTIVFCVDQAHARQMRDALKAELADEVARYPDYIERIVADEGMEGKRSLGRFSNPRERTPAVVTTSKLLTTGVDVPTCKNIVLAKPITSMVEFKQIIGRGTRLHPPDKMW